MIEKYFILFHNFSCEQLIAQNAQLRAQLEESHRTNECLTNDLQKLTNDWESLRDEMLSKEDEWKMEEEVKYFLLKLLD